LIAQQRSAGSLVFVVKNSGQPGKHAKMPISFVTFWTNFYYEPNIKAPPPSYWYTDTLVTLSTNELMHLQYKEQPNQRRSLMMTHPMAYE
jgi:hypothetical protein